VVNVNRCRRTLQAEGHSAAGCLAADCGVQSRSGRVAIVMSSMLISGIRLVTQRSRIRVSPGPLSSNILEQVIYIRRRSAQANSAFHPSGVGKCVALVPGNTHY